MDEIFLFGEKDGSKEEVARRWMGTKVKIMKSGFWGF
jgi:hypothetical protein